MRLTVPLNPLTEETLTEVRAEPPGAEMESAVEPALMATDVPVPLRATVCVVPTALSVTVRVPLTGPALVGAKLTEMGQEDPGARLLPQVFVC